MIANFHSLRGTVLLARRCPALVQYRSLTTTGLVMQNRVLVVRSHHQGLLTPSTDTFFLRCQRRWQTTAETPKRNNAAAESTGQSTKTTTTTTAQGSTGEVGTMAANGKGPFTTTVEGAGLESKTPRTIAPLQDEFALRVRQFIYGESRDAMEATARKSSTGVGDKKTGEVSKFELSMRALRARQRELQHEHHRMEEHQAAQDAAKVQLTTYQKVMRMVQHTMVGFKLFFLDVRIGMRLVGKITSGKTLTRRERKQLIRTTSDIFRMVPFSIFVIVPFMELLLPVALWLFPGMLPSSFRSSREEDENRQRQLKVKLDMARFLQDTIEEMSITVKGDGSSVGDFARVMREIRSEGSIITTEDIIKFSKSFRDELTLDNLQRPQLVALCKILMLPTVGTTNILRFQLNYKLRQLRADDELIEDEGIENLTTAELQAACQARGMRAIGLSEDRLRYQLQQWIDLHLHEHVPTSLLLMSRALYLPDGIPVKDMLKATISALPEEVVEEAESTIRETEGDTLSNAERLKVLEREQKRIEEEDIEEKKAVEQAKEHEAAAAAAVAAADVEAIAAGKLPDALSVATAGTATVEPGMSSGEQIVDMAEVNAASKAAAEAIADHVPDDKSSPATTATTAEERAASAMEDRTGMEQTRPATTTVNESDMAETRAPDAGEMLSSVAEDEQAAAAAKAAEAEETLTVESGTKSTEATATTAAADEPGEQLRGMSDERSRVVRELEDDLLAGKIPGVMEKYLQEGKESIIDKVGLAAEERLPSTLTNEELRTIAEAVWAGTKGRIAKEREELTQLKETRRGYKESMESAQEETPGAVKESVAAKRLGKRVDKMIMRLDRIVKRVEEKDQERELKKKEEKKKEEKEAKLKQQQQQQQHQEGDAELLKEGPTLKDSAPAVDSEAVAATAAGGDAEATAAAADSAADRRAVFEKVRGAMRPLLEADAVEGNAVSVDDLVGAILKLKNPPSPETTRALVDSLDLDHDGMVSVEEVLVVLEDLQNGGADINVGEVEDFVLLAQQESKIKEIKEKKKDAAEKEKTSSD
eukprot:Clim_evm2s162 gene=Clim_evmTU2s162